MEDGRRTAARAAEALAPEAGLLGDLDPVAFGKSLVKVFLGAARHPIDVGAAVTRFSANLIAGAAGVAASTAGLDAHPQLSPEGKDRRFGDPAWRDNPVYAGLLQSYLAGSKLLSDLVDAAGLDERDTTKGRFVMKMMSDALAPTNFLLGNPAALKKAVDTGGLSLLRGARNFARDLATNGGVPRQVDTSAFEIGKDLAATPGKVVYRSDLMELIQYAPQTEEVFSTPLLCSPPWINKYYIMDLAPGRSFVEWAVTHGHTVFAISYRNPTPEMRSITLDDYLLDGPRTALDVITEITGSPRVNIAGLCVGGTLTIALLSYLAAAGDDRVRSATLLNTLVDFSEPGPLAVFTDAETVAGLERRMAGPGYLDSSEMARTFDLLRANDLIWNYVGSNWLMGLEPPAFDILAWNSDGTRMPAEMHSFYLRSFYLDNALARDELELAGTPLKLGDITEDIYLLAAKEDHIAPWKASYKTTQLLKADVRFVLSSSGHIAGIVNPPGGKSHHWVNPELPPSAAAWLEGAESCTGSWWQDWTTWIEERAGERRAPPPLGSAAYPAIDEAPGRYVLER